MTEAWQEPTLQVGFLVGPVFYFNAVVSPLERVKWLNHFIHKSC